MSHNFPVPADDDMEKLIGEVFAAIPEADPSRLATLEKDLMQVARRKKSTNNLNKLPWWFVLLLTAGFATAAWQVAEKYWPTAASSPTSRELVKMQDNSSQSDNRSGSQQVEKDTDDEIRHQESPVIYQRENF